MEWTLSGHYSSRIGPLPLLLCLALAVLHTGSLESGLLEYCQSEHFNVTCPPDHVILMSRASYGRMAIGRCVNSDHGYLGCNSDVLNYMHKKCSGRKKCSVYIAEPELHDKKPCPKDFASYLEAAYDCIKVAKAGSFQCGHDGKTALQDETGYISSLSTYETSYGIPTCPWRISTEAGRRIKLDLFNFGARSLGNRCYQGAQVIENGEEREISICESSELRENVYTSSGNQIDIRLMSDIMPQGHGPFLIRYEVTGCADIKPRRDAWVRREGDYVTITCNVTGETWTVTCDGTDWVGELADCGQEVTSWNLQQILGGSDRSFPYGILILVAIGVALGVFLGGLLLSLSIFYIKKRQKTKRRHTAGHYSEAEQHPKLLEGMSPDCTHWAPATTLNCDNLQDPRGPLRTDELVLSDTESAIKDASSLCGTYHGRPCRITVQPGGTRVSHVYESPQFT